MPAVVGQPAEERFTDVPLGSGPEPDSPWDDDDSLETPLVRDGNVESVLNLGPSFLTTSLPAAEQKEHRGFGLGALAAALLAPRGAIDNVSGSAVTARGYSITSPSST